MFNRKSKFEKTTDAIFNVLDAVGGSSGRRQKSKGGFRRAQQGGKLLAFVAPIAWANRDKIKNAADSALRMAQERLEASKQALSGKSETQGSKEQGQQQEQPQSQQQQPQQQPQSQQQPQPQQQQPQQPGINQNKAA